MISILGLHEVTQVFSAVHVRRTIATSLVPATWVTPSITLYSWTYTLLVSSPRLVPALQK